MTEAAVKLSAKEIGPILLAPALPLGNHQPAVTVADAFRVAFDALMRASGRTATDIADEVGISQATLTKLRKGQRGASFDMLERLRVAFDVEPWGLFDPDSALEPLGLSRLTANGLGHKGNIVGRDDGVTSASPVSAAEGGGSVFHPDQELLVALLSYWDAMTPEARLEMVGHGRRLRAATADGRSPKARA